MHTIPADEYVEAAIALHQTGDAAGAEPLYQAALAVAPDHPRALFLLAMLYDQCGQPDAALPLVLRSLAAEPGQVPALNCLGSVLMRLGRHADAEAPLREALAQRPDSVPLLNNLGLCLLQLGRAEEARACLAHAVAIEPAQPETLATLAGLAMNGLRWAEAANLYRRLLALAETPEAWNNLGVACQQQEDLTAATAAYARALALRPDWAEAWYNLGCAHGAGGDRDGAAEAYRAALRADPLHGAARLALAMAPLPLVPDDQADAEKTLAAYAAGLGELEAAAAEPAVRDALAAAIGGSTPFLLPYLLPQGGEAPLQTRFGGWCSRLLAGPAPVVPPRRERIRLAIVSGYYHDHTIWKLFLEGWLRGFDRERFEVIALHTGSRRDARTDEAEALADMFLTAPPSGDWAALLTALAPDVILYPEIGMDPATARLAAMRLAPLQLAAWGHPVTSGHPTIDVFVTGALMEPPEPAREGAEERLALPGIGHAYAPDPALPSAIDRAALGLRPGASLLWLGQALYKFAPVHDRLWARIARDCGDCQLLFIRFARSTAVSARFEARLAAAFRAEGVDPDRHLVMLPSLPQADFIAAAGLCDLVLDPPAWSGGRSTLDLLAIDPVLVTAPGATMRSRHTAGILAAMGMEDCISPDLDAYAARTAALVRDPQARAAIRARVGAGKHRVYAHADALNALQDFIRQRVRGG